MEHVTGIGGFFFRSAAPAELRRWYAENLGIPPSPASYDQDPWRQTEGWTVFEAFDAADPSFGGPSRPFALNFRVSDLGAMVEQLRAAGIEVEVDPEDHPNGRFASLADPDGNPIQLWEPDRP